MKSIGCKIGFRYYSFENLSRIANKMGYNPDGKSLYFLSGNFYENIFNPVLLFDTKTKKWNIHHLINIRKQT